MDNNNNNGSSLNSPCVKENVDLFSTNNESPNLIILESNHTEQPLQIDDSSSQGVLSSDSFLQVEKNPLGLDFLQFYVENQPEPLLPYMPLQTQPSTYIGEYQQLLETAPAFRPYYQTLAASSGQGNGSSVAKNNGGNNNSGSNNNTAIVDNGTETTPTLPSSGSTTSVSPSNTSIDVMSLQQLPQQESSLVTATSCSSQASLASSQVHECNVMILDPEHQQPVPGAICLARLPPALWPTEPKVNPFDTLNPLDDKVNLDDKMVNVEDKKEDIMTSDYRPQVSVELPIVCLFPELGNTHTMRYVAQTGVQLNRENTTTTFIQSDRPLETSTSFQNNNSLTQHQQQQQQKHQSQNGQDLLETHKLPSLKIKLKNVQHYRNKRPASHVTQTMAIHRQYLIFTDYLTIRAYRYHYMQLFGLPYEIIFQYYSEMVNKFCAVAKLALFIHQHPTYDSNIEKLIGFREYEMLYDMFSSCYANQYFTAVKHGFADFKPLTALGPNAWRDWDSVGTSSLLSDDDSDSDAIVNVNINNAILATSSSSPSASSSSSFPSILNYQLQSSSSNTRPSPGPLNTSPSSRNISAVGSPQAHTPVQQPRSLAVDGTIVDLNINPITQSKEITYNSTTTIKGRISDPNVVPLQSSIQVLTEQFNFLNKGGKIENFQFENNLVYQALYDTYHFSVPLHSPQTIQQLYQKLVQFMSYTNNNYNVYDEIDLSNKDELYQELTYHNNPSYFFAHGEFHRIYDLLVDLYKSLPSEVKQTFGKNGNHNHSLHQGECAQWGITPFHHVNDVIATQEQIEEMERFHDENQDKLSLQQNNYSNGQSPSTTSIKKNTTEAGDNTTHHCLFSNKSSQAHFMTEGDVCCLCMTLTLSSYLRHCNETKTSIQSTNGMTGVVATYFYPDQSSQINIHNNNNHTSSSSTMNDMRDISTLNSLSNTPSESSSSSLSSPLSSTPSSPSSSASSSPSSQSSSIMALNTRPVCTEQLHTDVYTHLANRMWSQYYSELQHRLCWYQDYTIQYDYTQRYAYQFKCIRHCLDGYEQKLLHTQKERDDQQNDLINKYMDSINEKSSKSRKKHNRKGNVANFVKRRMTLSLIKQQGIIIETVKGYFNTYFTKKDKEAKLTLSQQSSSHSSALAPTTPPQQRQIGIPSISYPWVIGEVYDENNITCPPHCMFGNMTTESALFSLLTTLPTLAINADGVEETFSTITPTISASNLSLGLSPSQYITSESHRLRSQHVTISSTNLLESNHIIYIDTSSPSFDFLYTSPLDNTALGNITTDGVDGNVLLQQTEATPPPTKGKEKKTKQQPKVDQSLFSSSPYSPHAIQSTQLLYNSMNNNYVDNITFRNCDLFIYVDPTKLFISTSKECIVLQQQVLDAVRVAISTILTQQGVGNTPNGVKNDYHNWISGKYLQDLNNQAHPTSSSKLVSNPSTPLYQILQSMNEESYNYGRLVNTKDILNKNAALTANNNTSTTSGTKDSISSTTTSTKATKATTVKKSGAAKQQRASNNTSTAVNDNGEQVVQLPPPQQQQQQQQQPAHPQLTARAASTSSRRTGQTTEGANKRPITQVGTDESDDMAINLSQQQQQQQQQQSTVQLLPHALLQQQQQLTQGLQFHQQQQYHPQQILPPQHQPQQQLYQQPLSQFNNQSMNNQNMNQQQPQAQQRYQPIQPLHPPQQLNQQPQLHSLPGLSGIPLQFQQSQQPQGLLPTIQQQHQLHHQSFTPSASTIPQLQQPLNWNSTLQPNSLRQQQQQQQKHPQIYFGQNQQGINHPSFSQSNQTFPRPMSTIGLATTSNGQPASGKNKSPPQQPFPQHQSFLHLAHQLQQPQQQQQQQRALQQQPEPYANRLIMPNIAKPLINTSTSSTTVMPILTQPLIPLKTGLHTGLSTPTGQLSTSSILSLGVSSGLSTTLPSTSSTPTLLNQQSNPLGLPQQQYQQQSIGGLFRNTPGSSQGHNNNNNTIRPSLTQTPPQQVQPQPQQPLHIGVVASLFPNTIGAGSRSHVMAPPPQMLQRNSFHQ